jgi:hypothetical protein
MGRVFSGWPPYSATGRTAVEVIAVEIVLLETAMVTAGVAEVVL